MTLSIGGSFGTPRLPFERERACLSVASAQTVKPAMNRYYVAKDCLPREIGHEAVAELVERLRRHVFRVEHNSVKAVPRTKGLAATAASEIAVLVFA